MNEDLQKLKEQVALLTRHMEEVMEYIEARKVQQLSYPVDSESRIALGMGVQGIVTDTTPAGAVLVDTNMGQLKVLIA